MNGKTQSLLSQAKADVNHSSISSHKRDFSDPGEAQAFFSKIKTGLLNVDEWNKHSFMTGFEIFDENGNLCEDQTIYVGAFNRLSLKGSGKYDWVKHIDINDAGDELILTIKPTFDPTDKSADRSATSHFFTSESTNNFCLVRDENTVELFVIGLNEKQNVQESGSTLEAVRNVATANVGYYLGIQKNEWETFCRSFLESE